MLDKLGTWVSSKPASEMKGTIERTGNQMWNDHNSTFVATLMTSLVTDASRQDKLDEYWAEAVKLGEEAYFEQSMKVLCGLLVSGNMPNFANPPAPQSSSSVPVSSSSAVPPQSSGGIVGPGSSSSTFAIAPAQRKIASAIHLQGRTLEIAGSEIARIDLFSVSGSTIGTLWEGKAGGSVKVSLEGIPSGLYVVKAKVLGETIVRKINVR